MRHTVQIALTLSSLLVACGSRASAPEQVARRFTEAQLSGQTTDMIALATATDQAAATQAPNTTSPDLYPDENMQKIQEALMKRVKIGRITAEIQGEHARVTVPAEVPDIGLSSVLLATLLNGSDETTAAGLITRQVEAAPLKAHSTALTLVRENGQWRVDTRWAENTAAKRQADAERAQAAALQQLKDDYSSGLKQDLSRAQAALTRLVAEYPNDRGWKDELSAVNTLSAELRHFTVTLQEKGLYQGEYRIVARVKNGTDLPLRRITLKYTFLNANQPVGEPTYETFGSTNWFSTRLLEPNASVALGSTGTPPEDWDGQQVQADVTAYELDSD